MPDFSSWARYKDSKVDGFMTWSHNNRYKNYYYFKNGSQRGYGIIEGFRGEIKSISIQLDGYGFKKFANNDEYDG